MSAQAFPQIPASVLWGVRDLLQRSPNVRLDPAFVAAKLSVQDSAARQYVAELKRIGLIDDEGRPTDLAQKWRIDESYNEAVEELLNGVYPPELVALAPPGEADRTTLVNWFMSQGLGQGAASNKAATYLLISSPEPGSTARPSPRQKKAKDRGAANVASGTRRQGSAPRAAAKAPRSDVGSRQDEDLPSLNVNVQIHISADATNEQIEAIFSAMRRYLRDD